MRNCSKEPPLAPKVDRVQGDSVDKREILEYNSESETYQVSFESDTETIYRAVISTVAAVAEKDPQELPPLYNFIDPEALDGVVESAFSSSSNDAAHVSFTFDGYPVTIHSAGTITIDQPK